jgi:hypothetical protein
MVFGQLSNRKSMRDLIVTLNAHRSKFYRLGLGKSVTRSNLSKANEVREARIFKEYADRLIDIARRKRDGLKEFFVKNKVFAFDSTTISLCLSVYWWTKLHHSKGGVKAHTLYDVKTDVPAFVIVTDASVHDSQVMGDIPYEADAIYIFDRAYMDTGQLYAIALLKAFFVVMGAMGSGTFVELINQVEFESYTNGSAKFKSNILESVCTSITSFFDNDTDGIGFLNPLAYTHNETWQTCLHSKVVKFDHFKIWIVYHFPSTKKLNSVSCTNPILDDVGSTAFALLPLAMSVSEM